MEFQVEFTKKAIKDLKKLPKNLQKQVLKETLRLECEPFGFKKKIKRIRGIAFPCYRLRIDCRDSSYRLFYGIEQSVVFVLRIISKKDAEKVIRQIGRVGFPID